MNNLENKKTAFDNKHLALSGILVAVGFILHGIVPPMFFGVKPDFLLACVFVAIVATRNFKNVLATCLVGGIVAALTTGFPGGQIPNLLDKMAAGIFVFFAISLIKEEMAMKTKTILFAGIVFLGTIVSGVVFLGSALAIAGLPAPFTSLFLVVVLPTAVANVFVGLVMYVILQKMQKQK